MDRLIDDAARILARPTSRRGALKVFGGVLLGGLFGIVSLYYLRFFIVRHEPFTMIQMVILLCAAAFLFLLEPPHHVANPWFRGWRDAVVAAYGPAPVVRARTWLATVGWRKHGLIRLDEQPRIRAAARGGRS